MPSTARNPLPLRVKVFASTIATLFAFSLGLSGCHHNVDDATLTTNVQTAIANDPSIHQQPVQVAVHQGVVTLTGNVSDETASSVAAQDAARVKGVKEVVDSLSVAGAQVTPTVTSPTAPTQPRQATAQEQQSLAQGQPLPPPAGSTGAYQPVPAPPPPVVRNITAPAGTEISIRTTEGLSSETATNGQPFNGTVTRQVVSDGYVVIPAGAPVSGRVVVAKDAGHFKGHSELSIELTAVRRHGELLPIATSAYTVEGKNRGGQSTKRIAGGAAVGAIVGGILGHGKGAAIGALAGGGAGTAVQASTRGQQVAIPSESVIRFRLARAITVQATERPAAEPATTGEPTLQQRQPGTP